MNRTNVRVASGIQFLLPYAFAAATSRHPIRPILSRNSGSRTGVYGPNT